MYCMTLEYIPVVNMKSHLIVLFCVFLLFSFDGIEAKRRNARRRQKPLKAINESS